MVCIYCGGKTKVANSRRQKSLDGVWRRRHCLKCQATFTTQEVANRSQSFLIKHKSHVEPFSRDKLLLSLYDSLRHRPTAINDATALTDTIWQRLLPRFEAAQLEKPVITEVTIEVLKRFDPVAATHYQAFHP